MSEPAPEPDLIADPFFSLMVEGAVCLGEALDRTVGGRPGYVGVVPGLQVLGDLYSGPDGACGMAYVRLDTAFPSAGPRFGVADSDVNGCADVLAVRLIVGVHRCAPLFGPDSKAGPTIDQQTATTAVQTSDAAALHTVVRCCWGNRQRLIGAYTPVGPAGAIVGGQWAVTLRV